MCDDCLKAVRPNERTVQIPMPQQHWINSTAAFPGYDRNAIYKMPSLLTYVQSVATNASVPAEDICQACGRQRGRCGYGLKETGG